MRGAYFIVAERGLEPATPTRRSRQSASGTLDGPYRESNFQARGLQPKMWMLRAQSSTARADCRRREPPSYVPLRYADPAYMRVPRQDRRDGRPFTAHGQPKPDEIEETRID